MNTKEFLNDVCKEIKYKPLPQRRPQKEESKRVKEIMEQVVTALKQKGYEPVSQIIGYILSGDPTYITNHNDARNKIRQIERDELLEKMVKNYIEVDE